MNRRIVSYLVAVAAIVAVMANSSLAGTLSASPTAPTIDGEDIAQLAGGGTDAGGDQGHIWSNRPIQGQTFTTGANPLGYLLNSVTLQNLNNNVANNSATWTVRVGSVAGTAFNPLASEDSSSPVTYVPLDYMTFAYDTPVALAPNTLYGFDWDTSGSGFVTTNNPNSNYPGGEAFSSGGGGVPNDAALVLRGVDREFHIDMDAAVPEPTSFALAMLAAGGLGACGWRRRRRVA